MDENSMEIPDRLVDDVEHSSDLKPHTMRAARLHGIRDLRLEAIPLPAPGPGQLLLKVAAVGVCGSDVHYYLDGRIGSQVVTAPIILGHEFSAWVVELGPGVEGFQAGQLVAVEPAISCGECEPCLGVTRGSRDRDA